MDKDISSLARGMRGKVKKWTDLWLLLSRILSLSIRIKLP